MIRPFILVLSLLCAPATAQTWPSKPVRIVVPYSTGGGADTVSRILFAQVAEDLGQPFVIENRGGGGGTIGPAIVAKAPADGYTVLYHGTAHSINPALVPNLPYVRSGQVRAIAHTGRGRLASLPNLPPVSDTVPGFEAYEWNGVFVPAGTPAEVVSRLNGALHASLRSPKLMERLAALSVQARQNSPAEFAAFFQAELDKWGKVIREANIKLGQAGLDAVFLQQGHQRAGVLAVARLDEEFDLGGAHRCGAEDALMLDLDDVAARLGDESGDLGEAA